MRLANTLDGHEQVAQLALELGALVCFEATGGQEWRLWSTLDTAGIATGQLRPAQIKAPGKLGSADMFDAMDVELKSLLDRQIAELEERIEQTMASDDDLAATARILRSVNGMGNIASTMLIAEMPELGQISCEQAAARAGLAPIVHDSGAMRGKRAIGRGRRQLRHVMFQAALVASHHNPILKSFADRLLAAGKPHKVVITALARKLVTTANALRKSRLKWTNQAA